MPVRRRAALPAWGCVGVAPPPYTSLVIRGSQREPRGPPWAATRAAGLRRIIQSSDRALTPSGMTSASATLRR
jgi:hypothetical protein